MNTRRMFHHQSQSSHHLIPPPKNLKLAELRKNRMAKDKKDLESVTDYVEEKTLDQDKMNAAMGAMAKMKISEKKEDDR